jgi:L-threonylcarbamoyladenylate synthase
MGRYLRVDPDRVRAADLSVAVAWMRKRGIVAFPTDTFYGLGVNPGSAPAVAALFALKHREAGQAIPLVAASAAQVRHLGVRLGPASARLAEAFWPGPLSLILDAPPTIAEAVRGEDGTIAVRVPAHATARALADACGHWVTATSANRSGEPAAVTAEDLGALAADPRVFVLDGGRAPGGMPSTIVDARGGRPVLVRAGAVAWSRVLESLQE